MASMGRCPRASCRFKQRKSAHLSALRPRREAQSPLPAPCHSAVEAVEGRGRERRAGEMSPTGDRGRPGWVVAGARPRPGSTRDRREHAGGSSAPVTEPRRRRHLRIGPRSAAELNTSHMAKCRRRAPQAHRRCASPRTSSRLRVPDPPLCLSAGGRSHPRQAVPHERLATRRPD